MKRDKIIEETKREIKRWNNNYKRAVGEGYKAICKDMHSYFQGKYVGYQLARENFRVWLMDNFDVHTSPTCNRCERTEDKLHKKMLELRGKA